MSFASKAGKNKMDEHLLRFDKEKTLVFVDLETLNLCLSFCHNLPWQIAMIKVQGDKKIDQKDVLIKWDTHLKISSIAARMTGYDQRKIDKEGVSPEEIFPTVEDWLDNADYILGHNIIGFDIHLIREYYKYMGKNASHLLYKFIDTNCLAKGNAMGRPYDPKECLLEYQYKVYNKRVKGVKTNMDALSKQLNISCDPSRRHDALYDLFLNFKIWNKIKFHVEI